MKLRKIAAAFTAAVCFTSTFSGFGMSSVMAAVSNNFECDYEGWCANGNAEITAVEDGVDGSRAMLVSGRKTGEDGAVSEKGFYLEGGVKYSYNVKVKGEKADKFYLTLRWLDPETGEYSSKVVAQKSAKAGEWTDLSAKFKAPKGSINLTLFITSDTVQDFVFDDVSVTYRGDSGVVYAADKGLKDEFARYFKVGTAVPASLMSNSKATAIILKDFNSITCENELKPDATLVQWKCSGTNVGVQIGSGAASIMDFCVKNNIGMRGHTMVWYSQTPEWFFKENYNASNGWVSSSTMDKRMESYIKNMFSTIKSQYPSLNLYCYDICNECISDDSNRTKNYGGSRAPGVGNGKSPWVQVYGSNSFVEKAYTYARKYAPSNCKLFYNDYNEYWDHKRDSIYSMCKSLYSKGLLDGVGMQSHIAADGANGFTGINNYTTALKKYASIGCEVQITELDIDIKTSSGNYSDYDQAQKYKAIFQAAMDVNNSGSKGKVTAVCVWGVDDAHSWVNMNNDVGSNPLLYNSSFQPKTAYNTLINMIPSSQWGNGSSSNSGSSSSSSNSGSNSSSSSSSGSAMQPNDYGWYFDSTFENGTDNWTGRGAASVASSSSQKYVGSKSLYVSGRTSAWNGATRSLDTATFVPGKAYSFSTNVKYTSGNSSETFYLKLQYSANGNTNYATVAEANVAKGSWTQLANKSFTIPSGASNLQLYVETANGTCDYYMDEAIVAKSGTSISGAGSSSSSSSSSSNTGNTNTNTGNTNTNTGNTTTYGDKTSKSWNFSDTQFNGLRTVTSNVTIDGITLLANSSKPVSVPSSPQTLNGTTYQYCLALGGGGTTTYRAVRVPVSGSTVLKVTARSTGSDTRTLAIVNDSGQQVGSMNFSGSLSVGEVTINGDAQDFHPH